MYVGLRRTIDSHIKWVDLNKDGHAQQRTRSNGSREIDQNKGGGGVNERVGEPRS